MNTRNIVFTRNTSIFGEDSMRDTHKKITSIEEYIRLFPTDVQEKLQRIRHIIQTAAPNAVEMIRYQIPTFYYNGNLVHFAAYKNHIGFYPVPSGISAFEHLLTSYKKAKGSVVFPLDTPIPYDIIEQIVVFRVQENEAVKKK